MTKFLATFSFLLVFAQPAPASSFAPHGINSDAIADEIQEEIAKGRNFRHLNLQNKPLAFAGDTYMFDADEARKIVDVLPQTLETLDLSLNRLPEEALPSFIPLLTRPNFKYLDITVNSGADTLDGLRALTGKLGEAGNPMPQQIDALKKVIWVRESNLENAHTKGFLPSPYLDAHKDYFQNWRQQASDWRLPVS